jgi:hypothetical protein
MGGRLLPPHPQVAPPFSRNVWEVEARPRGEKGGRRGAVNPPHRPVNPASAQYEKAIETVPVPFEFADVTEARRVASLLRKQASAFLSLAHRLTGDEIRYFEQQARETLAIASRIDAAAGQ